MVDLTCSSYNRVFLFTDFCSSLKITDQSQEKIGCTIFCDKLEKHPKVFKIGDIVRMHRVKVQPYKLKCSWNLLCGIFLRNSRDIQVYNRDELINEIDEFCIYLHRLRCSMTPSHWSTLLVSLRWHLMGQWVELWSHGRPVNLFTLTRRTSGEWRSCDPGQLLTLSSPQFPLQSLCLMFSLCLTSTWPASCWPKLQ